MDRIYDEARRKRNIPNQRLSDTEEDLLKGRGFMASDAADQFATSRHGVR